MAIKHNVYEGGNVQSLGFKLDDGRDATVGVLEAGHYNFGTAKRREVIKVLSGSLETPNGMRHRAERSHGVFYIEEGETIEFTAEAGTSYLCVYPDGADGTL